MSGSGKLSLSKFELFAKLQTCEIELQYTKEEVERWTREVGSYKHALEKREKQIQAQMRRQRQIENLHKELINEYEQQVNCLKFEVKKLKVSHDNLRTKYRELQQKQITRKTASDNSTSIKNVEYFIKNCNSHPSDILNRPNTLDVLKKIITEHCIQLCDEIVKRPLSIPKLQLLEEEVLKFSWIVQETQQRLQKMAKELSLLYNMANKHNFSEIPFKQYQEDKIIHNSWTNLDWDNILNPQLIHDHMTEGTEETHDLENKIKSHMSVLAKLLSHATKQNSDIN